MIRPAYVPWPAVALAATTALIEDAATYLAMRGSIDPDLDEWPDELLGQLAALAAAGHCDSPTCQRRLTSSALADHWQWDRQAEWERSLPVWTCDCERGYKVIHADHLAGGDQYWDALPDGLLGDQAGAVRANSKGKVTHSDACPGCGVQFAVTIARRTVPEGALF